MANAADSTGEPQPIIDVAVQLDDDTKTPLNRAVTVSEFESAEAFVEEATKRLIDETLAGDGEAECPHNDCDRTSEDKASCDHCSFTGTERGVSIHEAQVHNVNNGGRMKQRIVDILQEHGELPSKKIKMLLDTTTDPFPAINELEKEERIKTRPDPEDRRRTLYRLFDDSDKSDTEGDDPSDGHIDEEGTQKHQEPNQDDAGEEQAVDHINDGDGHREDSRDDQDADDSTVDETPESRAAEANESDECVKKELDDRPARNPPSPDQIKDLREQEEWTQAELADEIGVSGSTVSSWENGRCTPTEFVDELWELVRDGDTGDEGHKSDDESESSGSKLCCGQSLSSLEYAIHRTEEHGAKRKELDNLEPGEFEEIVEDADSIPEIADELDWIKGRVIRTLGIYGRDDVANGESTFSFGSDLDESDHRDEAEADAQEDTRAASRTINLQRFGVDRREVIDALEGAQSIHHVRRDLGISRRKVKKLLGEMELLDQIRSGCAPLSPKEVESAVRRGAT